MARSCTHARSIGGVPGRPLKCYESSTTVRASRPAWTGSTLERWLWWAVPFGISLSLAGCGSGAKRVRPPAIDAAAAGRTAVSLYDRDGDKALSGKELKRVPSLKSAFERIDRSPADGRITAEEIAERVRGWSRTRIALVPLQCQVRLHGQPLEGATVTFLPESFLGTRVLPACGRTDAAGIAAPSIGEAHLPGRAMRGVQLGFYRVVITAPVGSTSTIPPRYRGDSALGLEIAPDTPAVQAGTLALDL